jgi:hypothetical protein
MSTQMYEWLMETPYYDANLDWVAVTDDSGKMVASCTVWLCGGIALVEPVGCATAHRRRHGSDANPRIPLLLKKDRRPGLHRFRNIGRVCFRMPDGKAP